MTPAINFLRQQGIPHEIHPFEQADEDVGYALGAAKALGVEPGCVFKTLMVAGSDEFAVHGARQRTAQSKAARQVSGLEKITMAQAIDAERVTGYKVGESALGTRDGTNGNRPKRTAIFTNLLQCGSKGLDLAISPQA